MAKKKVRLTSDGLIESPQYPSVHHYRKRPFPRQVWSEKTKKFVWHSESYLKKAKKVRK